MARIGHRRSIAGAAAGRLRGAIAAILAAAAVGAAAAPQLSTVEPRAFGYLIGDVVERRVLLADQPGTLDASSLPVPGRVGRWLALREAKIDAGTLVLRYQIVNAPDELTRLSLPVVRLRFSLPNGAADEAVLGTRALTLAPLTQPQSYPPVEADDLRPDLPPPPIPLRARGLRLLLCAIALAAILAALSGGRAADWLRARLGIGARGPFARARAELRLAARADASGRDRAAVRLRAMRALHAAFDRSAAQTVAADNLGDFLDARPALGACRDDIEALFAASRAAFFAGAPAPPATRWLTLAERLAAIEAGRRA